MSAQQQSVGIDWWRLGRTALPILVVAVALVVGLIQGPGMAILVLAGASMALAVACFWETLRALFGDTKLSGEDAFAMGAPSAEEERKQAVVRALKDLEFEHAVGKISERDYLSLKHKYRTEAKRLLRVLDERARPERERVEKLVTERLVAEGLREAEKAEKELKKKQKKKKRKGKQNKKRKTKPQSKVRAKPEAEASAATRSSTETRAEVEDAQRSCPDCGSANDDDAVFCKKCGKALGQPTESADPQAPEASS